MKRAHFHIKQLGFSLVEALLGIAVFSLVVSVLVGAIIFGRDNMLTAGARNRAAFLLDEAVEAAHNIATSGYSNLVDGVYGLTTAGNQWNFAGASDVSGIFTRQTTISSGGTNRKDVSSTIDWSQNYIRAGSASIVTRLTNWMAVTVGNWANPNLLLSTLNLSGNGAGVKVQTANNYAYVIRSAGTPNFLVINASSSSSPTVVGSLSLTGTLVNIAISGNYAYVTSTGNSSELIVVDISNPNAPVIASTYNASGNNDGKGIFVSDNRVYLGRATTGGTPDEFNILDGSNPLVLTLLGSVSTASDINEIWVSGNYAFAASSGNKPEFLVLSVSNASAPAIVSQLDLPGNQNGLSLAGYNNIVLMGRADSNLYVFNITNPLTPAQLGSHAAGASVNDISIGESISYAFLATSSATAEMRVVDFSNPALPTLVGSFNSVAAWNGAAYDSTSDVVYGATSNNSGEFVIIGP